MRDVQAQIQITAAFGREATTAAATYADRQAVLARQGSNEEEARKWDEGGAYRVALHAAIGLLTGNLSGAAGSTLSATALPEIGEMIADMGLPDTVRVALTQVAGLALGSATGGVAGATASFNTAQNYVSHSPFAGVRRTVSQENARLLNDCGPNCTQADFQRIDRQLFQLETAANLIAIDRNSALTTDQAVRLSESLQLLLPVYGTATGLYMAATGESLSGRELSNVERFFSGLAAAVPLGSTAYRAVQEMRVAAVAEAEARFALEQGIPAVAQVPGRVSSRINVANGRTQTTPLRGTGQPVSAGFEHVVEQHIGVQLANNRSAFTITSDELRGLLQESSVVKSPVTALGDGTFLRVVDTGRNIGLTSLSEGGIPTSVMRIFTDRAGNLITAFPVRGY